MKVQVNTRFRDKDDYSRIYEKNEVREFPDGRALELIELGLVERVKEPATQAEIQQEQSIDCAETEESARVRRSRKARK